MPAWIPSAAIEVAREAKVPVYLVGLGFHDKPKSARIADFAVPPRAYPGDSFTVTAEIEAQGMAGRQVDVELRFAPCRQGQRGQSCEMGADRDANGHAPQRRQEGANQVRAGRHQGAGPPHAAVADQAAQRVRRRLSSSRATWCARRMSKSSIARTTCCLWPAAQRASISSSAINCAATTTRSSTCCCKRRAARSRKTPIRFSSIFPPRCRSYRSTTRSSPSIPTGRTSSPKTRPPETSDRSARKVGRRRSRRARPHRRAGLHRRLGAGPPDDEDSQPLPRRVQSVADSGERRQVRRRDARRASSSRAKDKRLNSSGSAHRPPRASTSGPISRASTATIASKERSRARRSTPAIADPDRGRRRRVADLHGRAAIRRPAACFTWAAARCGGCGRWIPMARSSRSFTRSCCATLRKGGCFAARGAAIWLGRARSVFARSTVDIDARLTECPASAARREPKVVAEVTPQNGAAACRSPCSPIRTARELSTGSSRRLEQGPHRIELPIPDSRGRSALAADHRQGARLGKRQSAAQRRPAERNRRGHGRAILRRHQRGAAARRKTPPLPLVGQLKDQEPRDRRSRATSTNLATTLEHVAACAAFAVSCAWNGSSAG